MKLWVPSDGRPAAVKGLVVSLEISEHHRALRILLSGTGMYLGRHSPSRVTYRCFRPGVVLQTLCFFLYRDVG